MKDIFKPRRIKKRENEIITKLNLRYKVNFNKLSPIEITDILIYIYKKQERIVKTIDDNGLQKAIISKNLKKIKKFKYKEEEDSLLFNKLNELEEDYKLICEEFCKTRFPLLYDEIRFRRLDKLYSSEIVF